MTQPMKPFASVDETKRKDTFAAWRGKPAAAITTKRDEVERAMKTAFEQAGDDLDLAKVTAVGDEKSLAETCEALIGVHSELSGLEDALTERTELDRVAQDIRAGNRGGGVGTAGPEAVQLVRPAPRARLSDLIRADFKAHDGIPALGSAAFASEIARLPLKSTLSVRDDAILATLFKTDAGWAPESVRDPGYVPSRRHPIQFVDILPRSSTIQELVRYMEETTYTNAAAGVAEGAAIPESTLALTQKETAVRKIATHIPVTREEMEDEPQVESYLNDTLPFMVRQAVDLATLKGDGTAPNLLGLLNVTGIQDIDWTTTGSGATLARSKPLNVLRKAKTLIRFAGRSMATHYVLNPSVWDDIVLAESSAGGYYLGSPQNDFTERVWGLPVVLSDHLVDTKTSDDVNGLIGDFSPMWIQLRLRRELETEWGYINDDWTKEIMRIKASIRLALVVKRPQAFATISMP